MGHVQQDSIALIPDPHLLFSTKSSFDYSKLPTSLSIIGFIHQDFISSPICFSKHIVQITVGNQQESSVVPQQKKVKLFKEKVVKSVNYAFEVEGFTLVDALYTALEQKKCAIVHLYDKFYGYFAAAYTANYSSLIFGIIDRIPYLKMSIDELVASTLSDSYTQSVSLASNSTYLFEATPSQARTYSTYTPSLSQEGLLGALDRIGKAAKSLPGRSAAFLNEFCATLIFYLDNFNFVDVKEQEKQLMYI